MTDQGYDQELRSEREYVAGLYARLDADRTRAQGEYDAALGGTGGSPMERDVQVRASAKRVKRLHVADDGLCFGRLDGSDGGPSYIGRIGLFDEQNEFEPVLLDWRAPAARPFYTATAVTPEGMTRRRQFHTRGRRLLDFTDETFGRPAAGERGDAALLAAVNAPRGEGMRDIVATIQAEQDEIIRLDHAGVLVIEGGPGTGKTVVALHRVAYLLYTQRDRMERHGALVVGPNPAFLDHIARVLPSLGETDVVFSTPGGLLPGLHATAEDAPAVARIKGSLGILDVLAAAIADRRRVPEEPIPIELEDVTGRIDAGTAGWARDEARASGLPHNEARPVFDEIVTYVVVERAVSRIGQGWLSRSDDAARDDLRSQVRRELAEHKGFRAALDELWPILTPETLLGPLYSSADRLRAAGADPSLWRADGEAWTVSDVPLLDELIDLLGRDKASDDADRAAAARERAAEQEYAAGVLDVLKLDREEMDEDIGLAAENLLYAEDLADRFVEADTRELAERAAADRDWTYRHVVVDEAQELSEMDWRVLMRRCPGTVVHGGRRPRPAPVGGRGPVVGADAGAVRAGPLGVPVADGQLPHAVGDHGGRRGAARRVRARRPAPGLGPVLRRPPVVPPGHRRRAGPRDRRVRACRVRAGGHERRDRTARRAGCGGAVGDEGPRVRRRSGRRAGPHPGRGPAGRRGPLRRPHPRHPTTRGAAHGPAPGRAHRPRRGPVGGADGLSGGTTGHAAGRAGPAS